MKVGGWDTPGVAGVREATGDKLGPCTPTRHVFSCRET